MHRVAKWIKDGRYFQRNIVRMAPDVGHGQDDILRESAGAIDSYSARMRTKMPPAGHAVAAASADDVTLPTDPVANLEVCHVRADLHNFADKLMADHQRNGDRLLRPTVPLIDVQVCAADCRQQNADFHIVDAQLRLLNVFNPQTALGAGFNKSFHLSLLFWISRHKRRRAE